MNKINSILYKYNKLFDNNNIGIKGPIKESDFIKLKENNNFLSDYCIYDEDVEIEDLKTNNIYIIWDNYKNSMNKRRPDSHLYLCNFYSYITEVASVFRYKDSYIIGTFSNGFFKPSHFSPTTLREGLESIEELCKYNNIIFTVTSDLTNMLKKLGAYTDTSFSFPMIFRDEIVLKNIVTTNRKVLEVVLKKMRANEFEELYDLNFEDMENSGYKHDDKYEKYIKNYDKYGSFLESIIKEEYKNILKEVGDASAKSYDYSVEGYIDQDSIEYSFITDLKTKYVVSITEFITQVFSEEGDTGIVVDFIANDSLKIENKGELYKVMTTITNIIKNHIQHKDIDFIYFTTDDKRHKLYATYLKKYTSKKIQTSKDGFYYFLKKKSINEEYNNILKEDMQYNKPIYYIEKKENSFVFPKGTIYCWLYSDPDAEQKLNSGEYNAVLFKPTGPMRIGGQDVLNTVWNKTHLKKFEGSENLLGIIRGWLDQEDNILYIDMMTVNPKERRKGINSYMIQFLRNEFNLSQDQVVFDDPTPQGKKFMASKKY
jgi:hypothetical protein